MKQIDTSKIKAQINIDKDSELLQHLRDVGEKKKEREKMGLNIIKHGITISGIVMVLAMIVFAVLAIFEKDSSFMIEPLKIFFSLTGVTVIWIAGFVKGTSD